MECQQILLSTYYALFSVLGKQLGISEVQELYILVEESDDKHEEVNDTVC